MLCFKVRFLPILQPWIKLLSKCFKVQVYIKFNIFLNWLSLRPPHVHKSKVNCQNSQRCFLNVNSVLQWYYSLNIIVLQQCPLSCQEKNILETVASSFPLTSEFSLTSLFSMFVWGNFLFKIVFFFLRGSIRGVGGLGTGTVWRQQWRTFCSYPEDFVLM